MREYDFGDGPPKAIAGLLDKLNLSPKQMLVLSVATSEIAGSAKIAARLGKTLGLTDEEALHAIKASLASFLTGLEAAPNLDELGARQ